MAKIVSIPEETLKELLRAAGRDESVAQFLAGGETQRRIQLGQRFQRRAAAAFYSQYWLLFSAIFSWIFVAATPDVEGILSGILLSCMTVMEHKVQLWFKEGDDRGIIWGWRNQCLFALLFLIYGAYHGLFTSSMPSELNEYVDADAIKGTVEGVARLVYFSVGIVGGLGQFCLAWYYLRTKWI
jgi:hypothetical protein